MMFDCAKDYDKMLLMGINLSGENKHFFIQGRLQDLYRQLPVNFYPSRILDFGCGIGDTTKFLAQLFPNADIIGFDTSDEAIAHAKQTCGSARISFYNLSDFTRIEAIDLCYTNGVFHHIIPEERVCLISRIHQMLKPGGYFALFENNPWNPGTRLVMKRIPFDREARLLSIWKAKRLIQEGGFSILNPPRSLFYFPRSLAWLRWTESFLARFPLGGQYYILAKK
jgi:SAM-dependent methyltransferase